MSAYSLPGKNRDALMVDDYMDLFSVPRKAPLEIDCGVIIKCLAIF